MPGESVLMCVGEDEDIAERCATFLVSFSHNPEVLVFHCFEDNPGGKSPLRVAAVQTATDVLDAAGLDYRIIDDSGSPAEGILAAEREHQPDYILLGKSRRSTADKTLFGSVTERVMKETERPVVYA